jgi:quercetin dioxygenase-like cupin family protein
MSALIRPLSKDALRFRFQEELERIAGDEVSNGKGRRARTLVKDGPLRVTLVTLFPDGQIATHRAAGPITVQIVAGTILFTVAGETHELAVGEILAVRAGVEHAVASERGGSFLLTVALSSAAERNGAGSEPRGPEAGPRYRDGTSQWKSC